VISSAARSRRSQAHASSTRTRIARTRHESYGTDHESYRSRHESHRYAYESRRHGNTYTGRSRQSQLQGTGAGSRSSRQSRVNRTGAGIGTGTSTQHAAESRSRAGTGAGMQHRSQVTARRTRHDTIRHDTIRPRYIRYDTITYDTHETHETGSRSRIRYACERITNHVRYARHAWHSAAAQHSRQTDARHTAARIRTVNSQTVSGSHGKRQTVSGICKKRPGGGVNWIHFPFGG
jgi:hypothetical protein